VLQNESSSPIYQSRARSFSLGMKGVEQEWIGLNPQITCKALFVFMGCNPAMVLIFIWIE
jgi:hypothetical protein